MSRHHIALAFVVLVLVTGAWGTARADLPPPEGKVRVDYTFEVDRDVEGSVIVAFPHYGSGDPSNAVVVTPGKAERPLKGWTPGLYLVPKVDAFAIPKGDQGAAESWLASHAKVCLKLVPRIYEIETEANVDKVNDVIHLEVKGDRCEASLVKSAFTSADGKTVQGAVDASGLRTAPAPIGKGLPSVKEAGFAAYSGPSTPSPAASPSSSASAAPSPSAPAVEPRGPSSGCAGCTLSEPASHGGAAFVAGVGLAIALVRRRRRGVTREC